MDQMVGFLLQNLSILVLYIVNFILMDHMVMVLIKCQIKEKHLEDVAYIFLQLCLLDLQFR